MKRMTFTADSLVDVAVAHYIDDYEQKHGKNARSPMPSMP